MRSTSNISSHSSSFNLFKSILDFFKKQPKPATIVTATAPKEPSPEPKKHRASSAFSRNITASLASPNEIKTQKPIPLSSTSSITRFLNKVAFYIAPCMYKKELNVVSISSPINTPSPTIPVSDQLAAIELECQKLKNQTTKKQSDYDQLILQKVNLIEDEIKEHAARRVDLFFYLLLAVYGTNVTVTKGPTVKQHGRGSQEKGTNACHSSLFSHVNLSFTLDSTDATASCPTLADTQFEETLNMTVELPTIVNAFDGHLEGRSQPTKYVRDSLILINEVSKKQITPQEAMYVFFVMLNKFFSEIHEKYFSIERSEKPEQTTPLREGPKDTPKSFQKVWEFEKAGTFLAANKDLKLKDEYLHLMLRLQDYEITHVTKDPNALDKYYKRIQAELLAPREEAVNKMSLRR